MKKSKTKFQTYTFSGEPAPGVKEALEQLSCEGLKEVNTIDVLGSVFYKDANGKLWQLKKGQDPLLVNDFNSAPLLQDIPLSHHRQKG